ncbi:MAG: hypothetical protein A2W93_12510 [Bacteroidetes bacterium GWF2_43_63]|nr:MAG: hypothetical protein A2W94_06805 [Bacteroidetes bacterium GWE2_42_42]OFY56485.1 MAG: hypothetical protein A2W93_12510 [Bacteroidetes bacterium GWF2_43_63]HBG71166.1 hypothetical protein [Bacteroidales bacterium]HCB61249.1 hypothetical protein [Bacteroidales bacterium]HCY23266.1 hypothetical protein [Bacteroidales bacterium]
MKNSTFILIAALLILSSCSVFDFQSRAKHAHLNKVPVNESVTAIDIDEPDVNLNVENVVLADVLPEQDMLEMPDYKESEPIVKAEPQRFAKPFKTPSVIRDFKKAFKAQAKANSASENQSIDIVTLLIWVLVIAVILALLGFLLPNLWSVFIGLLLVVLIVMAIIYLAGAV